MSVALNTKHLSSFISEEEYAAIYPQVEAAHNQLEAKSGPGNDFLGWMYLPRDYDKEEFARIKEAAAKIREDSDVLVVAGIGGSYLGARAVIEAVKGQFHNELENGPKIYFCGNSISPTYLNNIISLCKGKRFSINVISKSGTTTETSLAFRVLRELLEKEMGVEEANKRIYATTDRAKGTLKQLADAQGWPTFVVPDDVGGRYSVLSAVGLLPIAAAGISIDDLMKGAADSMERFSVLSKDNDAYKYAAIRNILYRKGKSVEILECYEPDFALMNEWYKQLFGGGLAMGSMLYKTGLSQWIGDLIVSSMGGAPSQVSMVAIFSVMALLLSELTSHTASTNMIGPLAITTTVSAGISPIPVAVGIALSASLGFMLPISTPPNAIVYASGYIPMTKMVRTGVIIDFVGIACITIPLVIYFVSWMVG